MSDQTSIFEEVAEKVERLRTDEYFDTFLKLFNLSIPSFNDPTRDHLEQLRSWSSSLRKPMAFYVATEQAKAVGLTLMQCKKLLHNKAPLPEFVDHSAFQLALNAQSALYIFSQELLRIGRRAPRVYSSALSTPADPEEEEDDVLDSLSTLCLAQASNGELLSLKAPESKKTNRDDWAESSSKPLPISLVPAESLKGSHFEGFSGKNPQQKKVKVF